MTTPYHFGEDDVPCWEQCLTCRTPFEDEDGEGYICETCTEACAFPVRWRAYVEGLAQIAHDGVEEVARMALVEDDTHTLAEAAVSHRRLRAIITLLGELQHQMVEERGAKHAMWREVGEILRREE